MNESLKAVFKAILLTIVYILTIELIGFWIYAQYIYELNFLLPYLFVVQGGLQCLLVVLFLYFTNRKIFTERLKPNVWKWSLLAVIFGILFPFIQAPLTLIYTSVLDVEYGMHFKFEGFSALHNINMLSVILLIPIGEELIFRGYIQGRILRGLNYWQAILVSAILFSLLHAPYIELIFESGIGSWATSYLTLFGGLIAGALYYKSNSIGVPIIFHVFWNLTVQLI